MVVQLTEAGALDAVAAPDRACQCLVDVSMGK